MSDLLTPDPVYKPFRYPWAYDAWLTQQRIHWLPEEVPMAQDVKEWQEKLTDGERNLLTHIFRFFTQADVEVNNAYMKYLAQAFEPTEVLMMLSAFSNIETVHIAAYAHLLDTIGMPETEYRAFLEYEEMAEKWKYMQKFGIETKADIARTLALFGAFTEGMQLFSSFAILLNFPRHNKMKGMGQIVAWASRDETLHTQNTTRLFRTFIQENPDIQTAALEAEIYESCRSMVRLEDRFIELAFEMGDVQGLGADEVKAYIRYIGNRRLIQLGLEPIYEHIENPLPWMDAMLNGAEHANFFEQRATEYSRAATRGSWEEVFDGQPETA